ncbi:MAG: undecaprenyldiphospho-muramoylpentapeptide beta-N-acetylglucosaminyltransferase [Candidatus Competibacteraceae bacterium]|jgi:UDP-N-acetylglucosamine--N-acetylmuramyl-(pentapeptide) pyrophosphoryl-undecaprenol N-acetylglucosamine transferase|nr:undecaprenyldiphospho-muramoylpentapeptide beta-N-acetylglucosaminyltransferase [Candidatus Competibacteraceae bacterium]
MSIQAPVLIMAGGTGGHVFPALAVAERLQQHDIPVVWMGSPQGLEAQLVPPAGIPIEFIGVSGLRGTGLQRLLAAPLMLGRALWQATAVLRRIKPCLALGMGGFASGPGGLMARCLGIPLVIHEQNALAGFTNRCLSRIANPVLEAFPHSFPASRQALHVGNPVRASIAVLPKPERRFAERHGPARLLVLGGSQGAMQLNQWVPEALAALAPAEQPTVWHQTGSKWHKPTLQLYNEAGLEARLAPFIEDMAEAYSWADLVLCRAGALTVAELATAGVGSILVPYPHATDDHQTANACFLEQAGAALVHQQADLTPAQLTELLRELFNDRNRMLAMANAAHRLAQPDSAERIAKLCLDRINTHEVSRAKPC